MNVARVLPLVLMPVLSSCGPSATEGGFDSANPAAKMYAIEQAARANNRSAIPQIIEQLDSDDPAVRSLAISTLKKMTGESYGYRDYDPAPARQEAVDRWVKALRDGTIPLSQGSGSQTETARPPAIGNEHG